MRTVRKTRLTRFHHRPIGRQNPPRCSSRLGGRLWHRVHRAGAVLNGLQKKAVLGRTPQPRKQRRRCVDAGNCAAGRCPRRQKVSAKSPSRDACPRGVIPTPHAVVGSGCIADASLNANLRPAGSQPTTSEISWRHWTGGETRSHDAEAFAFDRGPQYARAASAPQRKLRRFNSVIISNWRKTKATCTHLETHRFHDRGLLFIHQVCATAPISFRLMS